jgi:hypothetical protein
VRVRFQADADLNHTFLLAAVRREPAMDFRSAVQADLAGIPDLGVLAASAKDGRILVTHDFKTMPTHFADFVQSNVSAGVLLLPQHVPVPVAVEELVLVWAASDPEEWVNRICVLPL